MGNFNTSGYRNDALARFLAFVLGFFLPIDYVSVLPSVALDVCRYGLLAVLLIITNPVHARRTLPLSVLAPLVAVSVYFSVSGLTSGAYWLVNTGIVGALSALGAYYLCARIDILRPLLNGFVAGIAASSIDILLQYLGLPYMGNPSIHGLTYTGFSLTRTAAAPLFAVAIVILLIRMTTPGPKRVAFVRLSLLAILGVGMILTAGRGGVLGLLAALSVWSARLFPRRPATVLAGLVALAAVAIWQRESFLFSRLSDTSDFDTGRSDRNLTAWTAFLRSPLLGPDPAGWSGDEVRGAHNILAYLAGQAGLLGLAVAIWLLIVVLFAALKGILNERAESHFGALVLIIAVVVALLEPIGFFFGLARTILLFAALWTVQATSSAAVDSNTRR